MRWMRAMVAAATWPCFSGTTRNTKPRGEAHLYPTHTCTHAFAAAAAADPRQSTLCVQPNTPTPARMAAPHAARETRNRPLLGWLVRSIDRIGRKASIGRTHQQRTRHRSPTALTQEHKEHTYQTSHTHTTNTAAGGAASQLSQPVVVGACESTADAQEAREKWRRPRAAPSPSRSVT